MKRNLLISAILMVLVAAVCAFIPFPVSHSANLLKARWAAGISLGLLVLAVYLGSSLASGRNSTKRAAGVISLLLVVAAFSAAEMLLRLVPDPILEPEVRRTPLLAQPERSRELFRKQGFRRKYPCADCPGTIRIFTLGGSSTYGLPLHHSRRAYPEVLQRILDERRPSEKYEVLNAGMAGMGVVQELDTLREVILKYRPNIVTVCSWFNDTGNLPGWYGIPGKSDKEAYLMNRILWKLQDFPAYRLIHNTRLFALFRYYVIRLRNSISPAPESPAKKVRRPRSTPEEFEWALKEIIKLGEENGFLTVLIPEPGSHPYPLEESLDRNPYYRVIAATAREKDLPLVDPLTPMAEKKEASLFYDFIHPDIEGHRIIAEAVYDALFTDRVTKHGKSILDSLGVSYSQPEVVKEWLEQHETAKLKNSTLRIKVSLPFARSNDNIVDLRMNNRVVASFDRLGSEEREVSYAFGDLSKEPPLSDITLSVRRAGVSDERTLLLSVKLYLREEPNELSRFGWQTRSITTAAHRMSRLSPLLISTP